MKIEIKDTHTKEYCEEFVNYIVQYNAILKDPHKQIKNKHQSMKNGSNLFALFSLIAMILGVADSARKVLWLGVWFLFAFILCIFLLLDNRIERKVNKILKSPDARRAEIDESGVSVHKKSVETARLAWEDIHCAVYGKECIAFVPKRTAVDMIALPVQYRQQVENAIRLAGHTEVEVIDQTIEEDD